MPPVKATQQVDLERQLMIKTKVCQRLSKEVEYYSNEAKENEVRLQQMKLVHSDPYDIKKFEEVLGESYMMIPDSQGRLNKALMELSQLLQDHRSELDINSEWYFVAQSFVEAEKKGNDDGGEEPTLSSTSYTERTYNESATTAMDHNNTQITNVDDIAEGENY